MWSQPRVWRLCAAGLTTGTQGSSLRVVHRPQRDQPGFSYMGVTGHQEGESRHSRPIVTSATFYWSKQVPGPAQIQEGGRGNRIHLFWEGWQFHIAKKHAPRDQRSCWGHHYNRPQSLKLHTYKLFLSPFRNGLFSVASAVGDSKSAFLLFSELR